MLTPLSTDVIRRAPKVLLHDHLDGGLRPSTIVDLAAEIGHPLPAEDADGLARWFRESAGSGSLERYLETFVHTVAVMQQSDAIRRVARECVEDLAADGVVYAEVRYAPEQHLEGGLSLDEVVDAVRRGFAEGEESARAQGNPIVARQLLTAMRHAARSMEIAQLAVAHRDDGVVGFDIAGAEAGFPPPGTWTRSSTCSGRTRTSRSTPARRSGCRRSGRRCSGAGRTGSGTASASSTTSTATPTVCGSAAGCLRTRQADPAGDVPELQRADGLRDSIASHPMGLLTQLRSG
jgi:adenosine deaminase